MPLAPVGHARFVPGYLPDMDDEEQSGLREGLKRVAVALKESGVPFALAGGYAGWARGAPERTHDVDFLIPAEQAEQAKTELSRRGLEILQPPEDWLFKVSTDGVTVDILLRSAGGSSEELLGAATELPVLSVVMPVLSATDVVSEKLVAMDEHYCDFSALLPTMRALREQVDWSVVRRRSEGQPFAEAMLFLLERLEVVEALR
jgi:hypothetical protein